jgi:hypothetical protein
VSLVYWNQCLHLIPILCWIILSRVHSESTYRRTAIHQTKRRTDIYYYTT